MRTQFITTVSALAMMMLTFTSTAVAKPPEVVLLPEGTFPVSLSATAGEARIETVGGKAIKCTAETTSGAFSAPTSGEATFTLSGCKQNEVGCRSETSGGTKDAVETVLVTAKQRLLIELTSEKAPELGLATILPEAIIVNCGGVKDELRGDVYGLLTPGNAEVEAGTITFKASKGTQEVGTCLEPTKTCEELTAAPFEANLGAGYEHAGETVTRKATFGEMVTLTD